MSRDDAQLKVRLPADLKSRVEVAAAINGRSMNAEIVQALEANYPALPDLEDVLHAVSLAIEVSKKSGLRSAPKHIIDELEEYVQMLKNNYVR